MVTVLGTSMVLFFWITVAAWVVGGHTGTPVPLESQLQDAEKRCRGSDAEAKRPPECIDSQNCHVNNIGGEPAIRSRMMRFSRCFCVAQNTKDTELPMR